MTAADASAPGDEANLERIAAERADDPDIALLISALRAQGSAMDVLEARLTADLSLLRAGDAGLGFELQAAGRAVAIMAGQLACWMRGHGAENYTETSFSLGHHEAPYVVTVQRRDRPTPHEFRLRAEARSARLAALLEEARETAPAGLRARIDDALSAKD